MLVEKIMKKNLVTVYPQDRIDKALKVMVDNNINGAPVVDDEGNIKGMIVKADIYRFLIDPGHYESCPVDWVMTKDVVTAEKGENILNVAKRLREKNIVAIPVVEDNKAIGIITLEGIVDYFLEDAI
ncbi:CBS domain-containing protein [Clostridium formicaceticum]|uniref:CBS domain-containing protein n=1 Tax=Clostridium formicaceticum TaxID=1497 RepID=A0AAC9WI03_9CLOT|nr:CBS domain-containing protein [Clostridium formicaceticum]AOY75053.1 CBS domain-containing protein [Clostridium formicaceticum]ARE89473.1 Glycine betaine/carnitine/choline transport ATP-binding protein OpuCA [Clostridium formicaceticum]